MVDYGHQNRIHDFVGINGILAKDFIPVNVTQILHNLEIPSLLPPRNKVAVWLKGNNV